MYISFLCLFDQHQLTQHAQANGYLHAAYEIGIVASSFIVGCSGYQVCSTTTMNVQISPLVGVWLCLLPNRYS
jgi:hypothetical protein